MALGDKAANLALNKLMRNTGVFDLNRFQTRFAMVQATAREMKLRTAGGRDISKLSLVA